MLHGSCMLLFDFLSKLCLSFIEMFIHVLIVVHVLCPCSDMSLIPCYASLHHYYNVGRCVLRCDTGNIIGYTNTDEKKNKLPNQVIKTEPSVRVTGH